MSSMVLTMAMANNGLSSSAPRGHVEGPPDYVENDRTYCGFRAGKYMYPIDENEKDRMDIFHKFFQVARNGQLYSIKFTPNFDIGPRILDLGTGTGIWVIDMADNLGKQNLHAEIQGWDLALIQPQEIFDTTAFFRRDIESPWHGVELNSWDMIHIRMLAGSISDWRMLYQKVYRHLKPGHGWLEHVEIDFYPQCDDRSLPPDSALYQWSRYLFDATQEAGRPLAYNTRTREMLKDQNFTDIQEQIIRIPLNPWPNDPQLKEMGRWYNLALTQGIEAMTLGPLTRVKSWTKSDVERLSEEVKREICSRKFHVYHHIHIWTARRPQA